MAPGRVPRMQLNEPRRIFDESGYDEDRYGRDGCNEDGYDREGFNLQGYNQDGYDRQGYNQDGYNKQEYNRAGQKQPGLFEYQTYAASDEIGRDRAHSMGWSHTTRHRRGIYTIPKNPVAARSDFDSRKFDSQGFNSRGFNLEGFDGFGFNKSGYNRNGHHKTSYDAAGFRNVGRIGSGFFGLVTKVEDNSYSKEKILYARKQIRFSIASDSDSGKGGSEIGDDEWEANMNEEGKAWGKIQDEINLSHSANHRHVIPIIYTYMDPDYIFIVMPLARFTLKNKMDLLLGTEPTGSWHNFAYGRNELFGWMYCLAVGLESMHAKNIRHKDIKPQNILIGNLSLSGEDKQKMAHNVYLADFSLSFNTTGPTKGITSKTWGTPRYASPQALINGNQDGPFNRIGKDGDVFSLGCVFLEMLHATCFFLGVVFSGRHPLVNEDAAFSEFVSDDNFYQELNDLVIPRSHLRVLPSLRFPGLTEALIQYTIKKMVIKENQDSASSVASNIRHILLTHHFEIPGCCAGPITPISVNNQQSRTLQHISNHRSISSFDSHSAIREFYCHWRELPDPTWVAFSDLSRQPGSGVNNDEIIKRYEESCKLVKSTAY